VSPVQDEKKYSAVIDNYITIEETLTFLLKYIPYLKENKIVYSPKFIPLIIDTCGLIESIFLDILDLKNTTRKTFLNYSKLIQNEFNIENTISIFLDTPFGFLMPFKNWTSVMSRLYCRMIYVNLSLSNKRWRCHDQVQGDINRARTQ